MSDKNFASVIEGVVRERFSGSVIDLVDVRPDEDSDGDRIFRVTVVFDGANGAGIDPGKVPGLVRLIRSSLEGEAADRFPLVRFISRHDAVKLKLASA
jgi:hypothetical protein